MRKKFFTTTVLMLVSLTIAVSGSFALDIPACKTECKNIHGPAIDSLMATKPGATQSQEQIRTKVKAELSLLNECVAQCDQGISPVAEVQSRD